MKSKVLLRLFAMSMSTFITKVTNACNDEEQDSILFFRYTIYI